MIQKIEALLAEVESFVPKTLAEVEEFRIRLLGKKGTITALFDDFKAAPADQKKVLGQAMNRLKTAAIDKVNELKSRLEELALASADASALALDMTRPAGADRVGTRHPISLVRNQILDIFQRIGFAPAEGPEIEDDWHVFTALNFPPEHPARDMQDTFFIEKNPDILLRTHTSSIQVRVMQTQKKDNQTSVYQHYRNCCEKLGVPNVTHALNQMMVLDYLIANEDRHFNNFGLLRNPDTLEWLGPAPIYDSGSCLGYDKLTPQIRSGAGITCKPFKRTHQDQLRLVTSFDWLDLSKLDGIDQDIRETFTAAEEFIDQERAEAIAASVNRRIQTLGDFLLTQQPQADSTENDVERNVAAEYRMGQWL